MELNDRELHDLGKALSDEIAAAMVRKAKLVGGNADYLVKIYSVGMLSTLTGWVVVLSQALDQSYEQTAADISERFLPPLLAKIVKEASR